MQIQKLLTKTALNLFPPLLFNRIILKEISDDFLEMKVIIRRALFNINLHKHLITMHDSVDYDSIGPSNKSELL